MQALGVEDPRHQVPRVNGGDADIVGSFTPNSAAAELVFSKLKLMFGDLQMLALCDYISATLMLAVNKRKVG